MAKEKKAPNLIIPGQIDWSDWLAATKLSRATPINWLVVLGWSLYVALIGLVAFVGLHAILIIFFLLLAGLSLYNFFGLARRTKRKFISEPELGASFVITFSKDGVRYKSEYEESDYGWSVIKRWRRNNKIFLLYLSTNRFLIIPSRILKQGQAKLVTAYLDQHDVPYYKGPFLLMLALGFMVFFFAGLLALPLIQAILR